MTALAEPIVLRPQAGQEPFLASSADIAVFGGSLFAGKTFALLLEPLRHIDNPGFTFVLFRRVTPEIRYPGGLWDESMKIYPLTNATSRDATLEWIFPSGAKGKFSGLQYESDVLDWKSSQICLIMFDQLESFSAAQFWYMLSRNRSVCGVRPYIRGTCNPDPDSFLATLLAWWIDADGYAIADRSGVVRWFLRERDELVWADDPQEFVAHFGAARAAEAKSFTFVLGRLQDNVIGNAQDPGYLASVKALPYVEQERLLGGDRGGNWKVKAEGGLVFNRGWFSFVDALPRKARAVRAWDKASTSGAGDWTAGVKMAVADGIYYVVDVVRVQQGPDDRERSIRTTAELDGRDVAIRLEQEPGSAGVTDIRATIRNLAGFAALGKTSTGSKLVRAGPFSAQVQAGNVKLLRGTWNEAYLRELEAFPTPKVSDDQVDASSAAFEALTSGITYSAADFQTVKR